MAEKSILIFDTETTDLALHPDAPVKKQPHMIEFGAVTMNPKTGEVIEEVSILVNPGVPLEPIITKITGLTDEDLKDAPSFAEVVPQLWRLFEDACCVVAHNLPFDRSIIRGEVARLSINDWPWPAKEVCTVGMYKELWGRNPKLIELYEAIMGKPLAQTHRALEDVQAMVDIIQKEELWRDMQ